MTEPPCFSFSGLPRHLRGLRRRPDGGRPGGPLSSGLQPGEGVGVRLGDVRRHLVCLRRCRAQVGLEAGVTPTG